MRTYRVRIVITPDDRGPDEYAEANLPTMQAESAKDVVDRCAAKIESAAEQHEVVGVVQNVNADTSIMPTGGSSTVLPATPPGVAKP